MFRKQEIVNSEILKPKDAGFEVETCFDQVRVMPQENTSEEYFNTYAHYGAQEDLISDQVRTQTFMNAIKENQHLFKDKVVLEVGCGIGIFSMVAAEAGAKHVYGIEESKIVSQVNQIIALNNLSEKITILNGKAQEVELPVSSVDIIICDWMGPFLLFDSSIEQMIYARDKWLKKNGLIFPNRGVLRLVSIEDEEYRSQKIEFWDNVYGNDMSNIKKWALMEPLIDYADEKQVNSESCPIKEIDCYTVQKEDLDFTADYQLRINKKQDRVHAYLAWFDVYFEDCHKQLQLSSGPYSDNTIYKQTVFYLEQEINVGLGDQLCGSIAVKKENPQSKNLSVKISVNKNNEAYQKTQFFTIV